ncbi:hypothetical protein JW824_00890 [bacterium]|nr:hypothetical protein [bacterium]
MKTKTHILSLIILTLTPHRLPAGENAAFKYLISPGIGLIGSGHYADIHGTLGKMKSDHFYGVSGYAIIAEQVHGSFLWGGTIDRIHDNGLLFVYGHQSNRYFVNYGIGLSRFNINKGWDPTGKTIYEKWGIALDIAVYKLTSSHFGLGANFFIRKNSITVLLGGGLNLYITN